MKLTTRSAPLDIYREFPDLHSLGRTAFRLHPRRAENLPALCSKMGGIFINPANTAWPEVEGVSYIPLIQILKRDLPPPYDRKDLPFDESVECLQVLWLPGAQYEELEREPRPIEDYYPKILVRGLDAEQIKRAVPHLVPMREKIGFEDDIFPQECALNPERIVDYPHRWALSEYFQDILQANPCYMQLAEEHGHGDNPLGFYQTFLGAAPGIKIGGHPAWVQYPDWPLSNGGMVMDHLLTIASWEWDGGNHWRWKPVEDGDPSTSDGPNDDAGLMIGDAGDAYVFTARDGTAKIVTQCS